MKLIVVDCLSCKNWMNFVPVSKIVLKRFMIQKSIKVKLPPWASTRAISSLDAPDFSMDAAIVLAISSGVAPDAFNA